MLSVHFKFNENRDFMNIFKDRNVIEFFYRFKTNLDCKEYLA